VIGRLVAREQKNSCAGEKVARASAPRRRFIVAMQIEFDAPRCRSDSCLPGPAWPLIHCHDGATADAFVTMRDRPLTAAEWTLMRAFLRRTQRDDLHRRFGHPFDIEDETTARRFFDVKADGGEISWVTDRAGAIAGVTHRVMISPAEAEIAVLVRSDCQRRGIGEFLIRALLRRAARRRLKTLCAVVQRDNRAVLQLAAKIGYTSRTPAAQTVELVFDVSRSRR
jgi:GNAT superfamily N-acetyltransferase